MHPLLHEPALLAPGDRMSGEEFAEFIDGVHMPSPLSGRHSTWRIAAILLPGRSARKTRVCEALSEPACPMLDGSSQPDCLMYILPKHGGLMKVNYRDLLTGRPELATEIRVSSRPYELRPKLDHYPRSGVPDHLTILVEEEPFEWRVLSRGSYRLMKPAENGSFRTNIFSGPWIDEAAFWREDADRLEVVLDQGLASAEHSRFLETLPGPQEGGL